MEDDFSFWVEESKILVLKYSSLPSPCQHLEEKSEEIKTCLFFFLIVIISSCKHLQKGSIKYKGRLNSLLPFLSSVISSLHEIQFFLRILTDKRPQSSHHEPWSRLSNRKLCQQHTLGPSWPLPPPASNIHVKVGCRGTNHGFSGSSSKRHCATVSTVWLALEALYRATHVASASLLMPTRQTNPCNLQHDANFDHACLSSQIRCWERRERCHFIQQNGHILPLLKNCFA